MDKYIVVRIETYTGEDFCVLASTLLFQSREIAEAEAKRNAEIYYSASHKSRWEVHHLTEPTVIVQPTEAGTQGVV